MGLNDDEASARLSPEERERIVRGFAAWLDRHLDGALADEAPPPGLTPELLDALAKGDPLPPLEGAESGDGGCDLYSLWAVRPLYRDLFSWPGRGAHRGCSAHPVNLHLDAPHHIDHS